MALIRFRASRCFNGPESADLGTVTPLERAKVAPTVAVSTRLAAEPSAEKGRLDPPSNGVCLNGDQVDGVPASTAES